jgi:hypothetical protein
MNSGDLWAGKIVPDPGVTVSSVFDPQKKKDSPQPGLIFYDNTL